MSKRVSSAGRKVSIAEIILAEFESFKRNFKREKDVSVYRVGGEDRFNSFAESKTIVLRTDQELIDGEPFVAYVRVLESEVKNGLESNPEERIYLIRRHGAPGIEAVTPSARFVQVNTYLGKVVSEDLGPVEDDIKLFSRGGRLEKTLRVNVLEKDLFTFSKEELDAVDNDVYLTNEPDFIQSLRAFLNASPAKKADTQQRWRSLSKIFGLKDRPILDKAQVDICFLQLSSQLILTGFPGTGKTTTLIKRLSYKSDSKHIAETERLNIEENVLDRWVMFTPSELLKTYLKEAMNRQGLSASDQKVRVWDLERNFLGREILRFLKVGKSGLFVRTKSKLLTYSDGSDLLHYLDEFMGFFMNLYAKNSSNQGHTKPNYRKILQRIPSNYRRFRRQLLKEKGTSIIGREFEHEIKDDMISDPEIDILIFSMLKIARKLFEDNEDLLYKNTGNEILENIKSRYETQVAVDEATDFSVVQLGCMYYLAHPKYSSVSFVGDLMQRVTDTGLVDWKECQYISDRFQTRELFRPYRQTPTLLGIASKLYESTIGIAPNLKFGKADPGEIPKPLKFQSSDIQTFGDWFVERVLEIYQLNNSHLPTIAVFVPTDDDIDGIYEVIHPKLERNSIDVEKCKKGERTGDDSRVRIFSVEYIKGLEFEAVFFVNIDEIQNDKLVDKYVYVGLTRAKTFLGITYKDKFPKSIRSVENDFDDGNWARFI